MPIIVPIGTGATAGTGIVTYSGLYSTLQAWLNRGDVDLTEQIPTFIALFEARLNRILRQPDMETTVTLTLDGERVDVPDDFLSARALYIDSDPRQELHPVSLGELRTAYAVQATGKPEVYSISGLEIVLGPAPDAEYDGILTYYQAIPALSSENETNWLIVAHPDVYLYGALTMAEAFLWNDERIPLWKSAVDEALDELMEHGKKKHYGAAPLRLRASVKE